MIETLPAATSARPFLSNYVGAAAEVEGIMTQGLRLWNGWECRAEECMTR